MAKKQGRPKKNPTWWERTKENVAPTAKAVGYHVAQAALTGAAIAGTVIMIKGASDGYDVVKNKYFN